MRSSANTVICNAKGEWGLLRPLVRRTIEEGQSSGKNRQTEKVIRVEDSFTNDACTATDVFEDQFPKVSANSYSSESFLYAKLLADVEFCYSDESDLSLAKDYNKERLRVQTSLGIISLWNSPYRSVSSSWYRKPCEWEKHSSGWLIVACQYCWECINESTHNNTQSPMRLWREDISVLESRVDSLSWQPSRYGVSKGACSTTKQIAYITAAFDFWTLPIRGSPKMASQKVPSSLSLWSPFAGEYTS